LVAKDRSSDKDNGGKDDVEELDMLKLSRRPKRSAVLLIDVGLVDDVPDDGPHSTTQSSAPLSVLLLLLLLLFQGKEFDIEDEPAALSAASKTATAATIPPPLPSSSMTYSPLLLLTLLLLRSFFGNSNSRNEWFVVGEDGEVDSESASTSASIFLKSITFAIGIAKKWSNCRNEMPAKIIPRPLALSLLYFFVDEDVVKGEAISPL
jgi:hypothetical protein